MNYPKIGDDYSLTQDLRFTSSNQSDDDCAHETINLHKGEAIHFCNCSIHGHSVRDVGYRYRLLAHLSDDKNRPIVVTYKILTELVQSGVLVAFIKHDIHNNLNIRVEQLGLPPRALNVLRNMPDVVTVKDLVSKTETDLLKGWRCGPKALAQIKMKLSELGVSLMPNR